MKSKSKMTSMAKLTATMVIGIFFLLLVSIGIAGLIIMVLFRTGTMDEISEFTLVRSFYILSAVSLVLGTLLTSLFSSRLLQPFRILVDGMEKLSRGNFDTRIDLKAPIAKEEFKKIGSSFNSMAEQLGRVGVLHNDFINNFAHELQQLSDPPVKFLWVACRDPLRQDMALRDLRAAWQDLELVVTADKFMTKTAQMSDIFLPVTTEFESLDVFGVYFRHFLGINEPAIPPRGEALSDLEIARRLAVRLNDLAPGTSNFPVHKNESELLDEELPPELCQPVTIAPLLFKKYHVPPILSQPVVIAPLLLK